MKFRDWSVAVQQCRGETQCFLVGTIMHLLVFNLVILNIHYTSRSTVAVIEWKPPAFKWLPNIAQIALSWGGEGYSNHIYYIVSITSHGQGMVPNSLVPRSHFIPARVVGVINCIFHFLFGVLHIVHCSLLTLDITNYCIPQCVPLIY